MKVLIVEDEVPTAAFLRRGLTEEGLAVDVAGDAESADDLMHISGGTYDLVLLDVMLPGGTDGFALCRRWRREGLTVPVLFLTARDAITDRVEGLDLGGDDYLVKPFAFAELLARVRALLRRGQKAAPPLPELTFGDVTLDTSRRRVTRGGAEVSLTAREYQLLEYLMRSRGRVVSRTELWEHVWESYDIPDSNVVDVYIGYLRAKLGRGVIETIRGAGYGIGCRHGEGDPSDGNAAATDDDNDDNNDDDDDA